MSSSFRPGKSFVYFATRSGINDPGDISIVYDLVNATEECKEKLTAFSALPWTEETSGLVYDTFASLSPLQGGQTMLSPEAASADPDKVLKAVDNFAVTMFQAHGKIYEDATHSSVLGQTFGMILSDVSREIHHWHLKHPHDNEGEIAEALLDLFHLANDHGSSGYLPSQSALDNAMQVAEQGPWAMLRRIAEIGRSQMEISHSGCDIDGDGSVQESEQDAVAKPKIRDAASKLYKATTSWAQSYETEELHKGSIRVQELSTPDPNIESIVTTRAAQISVDEAQTKESRKSLKRKEKRRKERAAATAAKASGANSEIPPADTPSEEGRPEDSAPAETCGPAGQPATEVWTGVRDWSVLAEESHAISKRYMGSSLVHAAGPESDELAEDLQALAVLESASGLTASEGGGLTTVSEDDEGWEVQLRGGRTIPADQYHASRSQRGGRDRGRGHSQIPFRSSGHGGRGGRE